MNGVESTAPARHRSSDVGSLPVRSLTASATQNVDIVESRHAGSAKKSGGRPKSFVWQYYTQHTDANAKSKRCEVSCNFCHAKMLSRVEQMESHLAQNCPKCPLEIQQLMRERILTAKELSKAKKIAHEKGEELPKASVSSLLQAVLTPNSPALAKRQRVENPRESQGLIHLQGQYPQVVIPSHPLVAHWLAMCRNKDSPPPVFRNAVAEVGRLLIYEAVADWLPVVAGQVETPLGISDCSFVDLHIPVKVVPILRAGLVLLEHASNALPYSETFHVGHVRDEVTMQTSVYINKLPLSFTQEDRIIICDPMIGKGGTIMNVLAELAVRGASSDIIRIVTVIIAPPALEAIFKQFPGCRIFAAAIDVGLNEQGLVVPGLGDAGDRSFGTM